MLPIQMRRGRERDEKLAAIGPGAAVRHRQHARASVPQRAVDLVVEGAAPDGLAATARAGGVAALQHEIGDDAVEDDAVVFAGVGEGGEVLAGLWFWCQMMGFLVEKLRILWVSYRCKAQ